jgi:hypothetical protein
MAFVSHAAAPAAAVNILMLELVTISEILQDQVNMPPMVGSFCKLACWVTDVCLTTAADSALESDMSCVPTHVCPLQRLCAIQTHATCSIEDP